MAASHSPLKICVPPPPSAAPCCAMTVREREGGPVCLSLLPVPLACLQMRPSDLLLKPRAEREDPGEGKNEAGHPQTIQDTSRPACRDDFVSPRFQT